LKSTAKKLYTSIFRSIRKTFDEREAISITYLILEHHFKVLKQDIVVDTVLEFSSESSKKLKAMIKRLQKNEPIQYILGEADFYGRKFNVNPAVLIPRSETEDLIHLIIDENRGKSLRILDIGTGSGCIAVSLKLELTECEVYGIDVNTNALKQAWDNAKKHEADVTFYHADVLKEELPVKNLDIIVSNPPYVPKKDKHLIGQNVLDHEPEEALFVKDEDPLLFYRRIAELAPASLVQGGRLYFEINENYADDTIKVIQEAGFQDLQVVPDIHGSDRIVKGTYPV